MLEVHEEPRMPDFELLSCNLSLSSPTPPAMAITDGFSPDTRSH